MEQGDSAKLVLLDCYNLTIMVSLQGIGKRMIKEGNRECQSVLESPRISAHLKRSSKEIQLI